jgi:hypothetical protein
VNFYRYMTRFGAEFRACLNLDRQLAELEHLSGRFHADWNRATRLPIRSGASGSSDSEGDIIEGGDALGLCTSVRRWDNEKCNG